MWNDADNTMTIHAVDLTILSNLLSEFVCVSTTFSFSWSTSISGLLSWTIFPFCLPWNFGRNFVHAMCVLWLLLHHGRDYFLSPVPAFDWLIFCCGNSIHAFFYWQSFFFNLASTLLTSWWIELQKLLRCYLIHINCHNKTLFIFTIFVSMSLDLQSTA